MLASILGEISTPSVASHRIAPHFHLSILFLHSTTLTVIRIIFLFLLSLSCSLPAPRPRLPVSSLSARPCSSCLWFSLIKLIGFSTPVRFHSPFGLRPASSLLQQSDAQPNVSVNPLAATTTNKIHINPPPLPFWCTFPIPKFGCGSDGVFLLALFDN